MLFRSEEVKNKDDKSYLCPDGSFEDDFKSCYSVYGCPVQYPYLCHDGSCIDINTQTCPISSCPVYLPYRCPDGLCALDKSKCIVFKTEIECNNNEVACGNGVCVSSSEFCRPLIDCWQGYIRCSDGSCRRDRSLCPESEDKECRINKCPNSLCVDDENQCLMLDENNGCLNNKKCEEAQDLYFHFGKCSETEADVDDKNKYCDKLDNDQIGRAHV